MIPSTPLARMARRHGATLRVATVGVSLLVGGLAVLACNSEGATPNCADPAVGCGSVAPLPAEAATDGPAATDAANDTGATDAGTDAADTGVDALGDARDA